jgi:ABC-2 type transport system permease protein
VSNVWIIFKRELKAYFATPLAYVFIVIFLVMTGVLTFQLGRFYEANQADLQIFFSFHPWLYLVLIPAVAMRLWAEERKQGTIELLLTLPVSMNQAVVGKFLAAWSFTGIALGLTFPLWLTVNYLGDPDNGVILASYFGSLLMAGGYLAIGSCISAVTKNQVIAFVVTTVVCMFFAATQMPMVLNVVARVAPGEVVDLVAYFSFFNRFTSITKGQIDLRDLVYFATVIVAWLMATSVVLELKKAR